MPRTAPARYAAQRLLALAALTLLIAGCSVPPGTKWKKGEPVVLGVTPQDGYYELVTGSQLVARYQLQGGERLGFRTGADGRVEAVAGDYAVGLNSTKTYAWRKAK